jgi:HK97 family phage major capsid protein
VSIKQLLERRDTVLAEARERLDEINSNTDESRAKELEAAHDKAMAEYDRLDAQITREERMSRAEKEGEQRAREHRERQRPHGDDTETRGSGDDGKPEYRTVFAKVMCGVDPQDLSAEERSVLRQGVAKFEQRTQTAGVTTAGGYTVPTEILKEIEVSMKAHGPMYDGEVIREVKTSSGNPLKLPTINDTANSGGAHAEGEPINDDGGADVVIGQRSLGAYSFDTEFIRWSWELDQDSIFAFEALLSELLGERMARIANRKLTVGTGADEPNGIVTASSLGKTAAAQAAITFDELIDLEHSVDPAYRKALSCGYMFNDDTLKVLRKLKDGDGNYLWQAGNVQQGVPGTLNGRRYHINQDMDPLAAAKKVVLFGDMKKYWVRKVGSPIIGVLRERFWPDLGIAGLIRFDGELANSAAVKHLITAA